MNRIIGSLIGTAAVVALLVQGPTASSRNRKSRRPAKAAAGSASA